MKFLYVVCLLTLLLSFNYCERYTFPKVKDKDGYGDLCEALTGDKAVYEN
jgi:hypothetical protein